MLQPAQRSAWRFRAGLAAIFLLALTLRLWYLSEIRHTRLFDVLLGDAHAYDRWARAIAAGDWRGSEVFFQAPLYPYVLALQYLALGANLEAPRVVQAVLGALSCVWLALAGRRFFSPAIGLAAGAGLAAYGAAIFFGGLLQKTSLEIFLLTAALALLGELRGRPAALLCLATGSLLGLLGLSRENALALLPVVAAWLWLGSDTQRTARGLRVSALVLGALLVLLPVGLRNFALGGSLQLTTSNLGSNFYIGNHAGADGRYQPLRPGGGDARIEREDARRLAEAAQRRPLTPGEVSSYWLGRSLEFIRSQPLAWLRLLAWKSYLVLHRREIVDTDSIEAYADSSALLRLTSGALHLGVLLPLAALGGWTTRARARELWLWYALGLALASSIALFFVLSRFRVSLVPILLPFAAAGVAELWQRLRGGEPWRLALPLLAIAPLAVAANWPLHDGADPRATNYYALGLRLAERGELAESIQSLERAHALARDNLLPLLGLAEVERRAGHVDTQIVRLEQALRIAPDRADLRRALAQARLGHAQSLAGHGAPDTAISQLRAVIDDDGLPPELLAAALTGLSRLRSGCAEPELQDRTEALALAQRAAGLLGATPAPIQAALDAATDATAGVRRCRRIAR